VSVHRNWLGKKRTKDEKKHKTKRILISDVIRCTQPEEERRQLEGIRGREEEEEEEEVEDGQPLQGRVSKSKD